MSDPLAALVAELQTLYADAGRPAYRRVSAAINRDETMPDTVSHETVGAMLRGESLSKWLKVECLVRQLSAMAVNPRNAAEEVRRIHTYWVAADDHLRDARPTDRSTVPETPSVPDQRLASGPQAPREPAAVVAETAGAAAGAAGAIREAPGPTGGMDPADSGGDVPAAVPDRAAYPSGDSPGPPVAADRPPPGPVTGSLPHRNPGFTGRGAQLELIRARLEGEPWQPLVLHGLGGVGKTRLALEYAHREAPRYDLVWWVPAEQPSQARMSLAALGERLDLPPSRDTQQTVRTVLNRLETGRVRWLLVLDNANDPTELRALVPAAGGHVIITTRDAAWRALGRTVDVDVFSRTESIQLLRSRGRGISFDEADQLAERLGDLPLALEVAAMQSATGIPAGEYLRQLREHRPGLLAEGQPSDYPTTVAAAFGVAFDRLQNESPVAAQLLSILCCLGAAPVTLTVLRSAQGGDISPPLGRILDQAGPLGEVVHQLDRYGLVTVDEAAQHIQVHRVVQLIVRNALGAAGREQAYASARRLLATANPGDPDSPLTWELHRKIGPHIEPSGLIGEQERSARMVVLDQIRYLYVVGEYDGSRRLAEQALSAWGGQGDDEIYLCERHLVTALQASGEYERAVEIASRAWQRLRTDSRYGPDHPLTLYTAGNVAFLYRVFGRYDDALRIEADRVAQYRRSHGDDGVVTLGAMNNQAVTLRLLGRAEQAHEIDHWLVERRRALLGDDHPHMLLSVSNLARDLYELGRYDEALDTLAEVQPVMRARLGSRHDLVLLAARTTALALRKAGRLDEALARSREHYFQCQGRYGPDHQHTLAGAMTYANALRAAGQAQSAWSYATEAVDRYRRRFGGRNPLTLAAAVNLAAILRAMGEGMRARQVDEMTRDDLRRELGDRHPFTLAAVVGMANDLMLARENGPARDLLEQAHTQLTEVRGANHPDTLTCAVNLALARLANRLEGSRALLDQSVAALRERLGARHPQVVAAQERRCGECDIEAPPA